VPDDPVCNHVSMGSLLKRAPSKPQETPEAPAPARAAAPRILLVGGAAPISAALAEALGRRGCSSGSSTVSEVSAAVTREAPDLVVLLDDAAKNAGNEVIAELGRSPVTSVIPIAIVDEHSELGARLSAFRHGVCAMVRRQASVDGMAEEIARVVREVPERSGQGMGEIGEVTLEEFVATLAGQLRSGILSVRARGAPAQGAIRMVLGAGRPVSEIIDDFVGRLRGHVVSAEPLEYEFDELAMGTVELLDGHSLPPGKERPDVQGLRVLLADDDPGRADAVAQELRGRGAFVVISDLEPTAARFTRLREMDPAILLVGREQLEGTGYRLVQRLRTDLRLRWASLLVVDWKEVWPEESAVLVVDGLIAKLQELAAPEKYLVAQAQAGTTFEARLEAAGPARLVRALLGTDAGLRIDVSNPRATVQLDLSKGLVAGASAQLVEGAQRIVQGPTALAVLLGLASGRVHVERVEHPLSANLMTTADVAFEMASQEPPLLTPSVPPAPPAGPEGVAETAPVRQFAMSALVVAVLLVGIVVAVWVGWRSLGQDDPPARPVASATASPARRVSPPAPSSSPAPSARTPSPVASTPAPAPSAGSQANESLCSDLIAAHSTDARNRAPGADVDQAFRAFMRGDTEGAKLGYCRALERDPGDSQAAIGLVHLLIGRREGRTAAYWAERGLASRADSPRLKGLLGDALALVGDEAGARQAWLGSASLEAGDTQGQSKLGERELAAAERAWHERRAEEAERLYRRAAGLVPENVGAVLGLVRALLARNQASEAVRWAARATQAAPRNPVAWLLLGDALDRTGEPDKARDAWTKASEIAPTDPEVRHRMRRAN
jgi:CheY-like chemotaxis protein/predicted negative regulator of RcsB-dependent stress response